MIQLPSKFARAVSFFSLAAALAIPAQAQVTMISPTTGGALPGSVSVVGGIVLDLIGTNNTRIVSQLAASTLYVGFYDDGFPIAYRGNPGTIGIQGGFDAGVIAALGGGIVEASIRFTLWDGDSAAGNFDFNANDLLLNGLNFGNWSLVNTITHNSTGTVFGTTSSGFRNNTLDTGFFFSNNAALLGNFYTSLVNLNQVTYQLRDNIEVYDNYFDFTQGVDSSLIDVGQPPVVQPPVTPGAVPEPSTYGLIGAAALLGAVVYRRRKQAAARA